MVSQSLFREWQGIRRGQIRAASLPYRRTYPETSRLSMWMVLHVDGLAIGRRGDKSLIPEFTTLLEFFMLEHNRNLITVDGLPIACFEQNIGHGGILWHNHTRRSIFLNKVLPVWFHVNHLQVRL